MVTGLTLRKISLIFLVLAALVARYFQKGPFLPISCSLFGLSCPLIEIHGFTAPGYEKAREIYKSQLESGYDLGGRFTAYQDGKLLVDIWGGYTNSSRTKEWDEDTLVTVFSSGKFVEGLVIAMLVDKGFVAYEDKISKHWPEFGVNGNENFTVSDLLRYEIGLDILSENIDVEKMKDSKKFSEFLAEQKPNFPANTRRGYMGHSRGLFLNEIVKRVDPKHRSIGKFVQEEINKPLNVEFYFANPEIFPRLAKVTDTPIQFALYQLIIPYYLGILEEAQVNQLKAALDSNSSLNRVQNQIEGIKGGSAEAHDNPKITHQVELTSSTGQSHAGHMAKIVAAVSNKGKFGEIRIFSEETYQKTVSLPVNTLDENMRINTTLFQSGWSYHIFRKFIGWGGWGGSIILFDPEVNLAVAYSMNGASFDHVHPAILPVCNFVVEKVYNKL